MKKCFIVEINGKHVRTIFSETNIKIGSICPTEDWLGHEMIGGIVTKIFK